MQSAEFHFPDGSFHVAIRKKKCNQPPPGYGIHVATKHALEAIAEALHEELRVYNIKVQTINPSAYLTGYNETMANNPFRWLDDNHNELIRSCIQLQLRFFIYDG